MNEWICEEVPAVTIDGKVISTMLRQEQKLVRCKDCEHWWYGNYCDKHGKGQENADWFCADGERKEGQ